MAAAVQRTVQRNGYARLRATAVPVVALLALVGGALPAAAAAIRPGVLDAFATAPRQRLLVVLDEPAGAAQSRLDTAKRVALDGLRARRAQSGARVLSDYSHLPILLVDADRQDVLALAELPGVASIEPDYAVRASLNWSIPAVEADHVHDEGITGVGVTVAVLDTGIIAHPALAGAIVGEVDCDPLPCVAGPAPDGEGHGTHVAGIVASTDSVYGGMAPGVELVAVKVLNDLGQGTSSQVLAGINWVLANLGSFTNLQVINLSLGTEVVFTCPCTEAMAVAVNSASANGLVVAVASGNDSSTTGIDSPACAATALSVLYTGANPATINILGSASNRDVTCEDQQIAAPGGAITSTLNSLAGGFVNLGGTSMASPHVAGTAALLYSEAPNAEREAIATVIRWSGVTLPDPVLPIDLPRLEVQAAHRCVGELVAGPSTTRTTLAAGLAAAGAGDRLVLEAGSYSTGGTVNQAVTLKACDTVTLLP